VRWLGLEEVVIIWCYIQIELGLDKTTWDFISCSHHLDSFKLDLFSPFQSKVGLCILGYFFGFMYFKYICIFNIILMNKLSIFPSPIFIPFLKKNWILMQLLNWIELVGIQFNSIQIIPLNSIQVACNAIQYFYLNAT